MADGKDRAANVFGNEQDPKVYEKACRGKEGFIKKFGDDSATVYHLRAEKTPAIGDILGVKNLVMDETGADGLDLYADAAASPAAPATVSILPSSKRSKDALIRSMSSLMVDFAAPNNSQNSLRVWIRLGVSVSIRVNAPRRSFRLILSMCPVLSFRMIFLFFLL